MGPNAMAAAPATVPAARPVARNGPVMGEENPITSEYRMRRP